MTFISVSDGSMIWAYNSEACIGVHFFCPLKRIESNVRQFLGMEALGFLMGVAWRLENHRFLRFPRGTS